MFDLVVRGGRVLDPGNQIDGLLDVGFAAGKVAAVEPALPVDNARARGRRAGRLVVPGLIDLHTHVYWGGTSLGVDADALARRSGTTTFVDAGSAGPGNFLGFRQHVMERSPRAHPGLSQHLVRRHLRLLAKRDGRRMPRHPPAATPREACLRREHNAT